MVHRIDYLVRERQVNPKRIRILMFNALARRQFRDKLSDVGVPEALRPEVHTFHSFSYQFIGQMVASGHLRAALDFWIDDKAEVVRIYVHRAIESLVSSRKIPPDSVDVDEVIDATGFYKGSLIPPLPSRAGYRGNPYVPLVYEEFERLRNERGGVTFDDFVPLAVGILENDAQIKQAWCGQSDFVIADEYQDVNYGQQRLIELLAGDRADVMVVGDDHQTIYEWRGARPNYILREFLTVFDNKPVVDYPLSRSFRFGPVIAQCAQNVIAFNGNRIEKRLIAHAPAKPAHLDIWVNSSEQATDANKELARQVKAIVRESGDPRKIIVLARAFAQLGGLEAEFLANSIPYRVLGRSPFFERHELVVLLDYIRFAMVLDRPVSPEADRLLNSIVNTPNRKVNRGILSRVIERAELAGTVTRATLQRLADPTDSPFSRAQRAGLADLLELLDRIQERVVGVLHFINHVEHLDPTQGRPEDEQILMTTVFRTKGLEYDYVIIPNCEEGYMPLLRTTGGLVFDKAGFVKEPEPSEAIENERRLFYVAITRAMKGVLIGTSTAPTPGQPGQVCCQPTFPVPRRDPAGAHCRLNESLSKTSGGGSPSQE